MKTNQEYLAGLETIEKPEIPYTTLNLGPTHPATHGIFQNVLQMDGERIVDGEQTVGYIHRAFEKIAERRPFYQITPLTDRLNYCSAPINNMGWHLTVEKLLGVKVPKRVDYMRVLVMELARVSDHIQNSAKVWMSNKLNSIKVIGFAFHPIGRSINSGYGRNFRLVN